MLITLADLEKDASQWGSNISAGVNAKMSTGFQASNLPDGRLLVTNTGTVPFAGGLVSRKLQVPQMVGAGGQPTFPSFAELRTLITVPSLALFNLARLETDFLAVFASGAGAATLPNNKANCSTQLNLSSGHFEVDASPTTSAWSDIGDGPGQITPDAEHELIIKCAFDIANSKRSVQSISWDGKVYPVPSNLQNIAFQPSNWGVTSSIQKQNEMFKPGSTFVIYRATSLSWSDQPF